MLLYLFVFEKRREHSTCTAGGDAIQFLSKKGKTSPIVFHNFTTKDVYTYRVPTQVLQSLVKSYICFSVCKAL